MILQTFHWTVWLGILTGVATVIIAIIYTLMTDEQRKKFVSWFAQKQPEEEGER